MITKKAINEWLITGFYTGLSPVVPGTVGSLPGVVFAWLIIYFLPCQPYLIGVLGLFFFTIGVPLASWGERHIFQSKDPGQIVIDEIAGMLITAAPIAYFTSGAKEVKTWVYLGMAFLLFRIFDIVKPFPINKSQNLPGGWGIMVDDVLAGIYAAIILVFMWKYLDGFLADSLSNIGISTF